ncbi:S9 family peptidase [Aliikangiella maris]|uniref:Prolyl oligopeptidase family serine peptidase n=2 Tax=Aliikangiella maris TaxID=3162458 RepID=A0ABV3MUT0_9GAMM
MRLKSIVLGAGLLFAQWSTYSVGEVGQSDQLTAETATLINGSAPVDVNYQLNLSQIMADPDWMGSTPMNPHWSNDSQSLLFSKKVKGHSHRQSFQYVLAKQQTMPLSDEKQLWHASQTARLSPSGQLGTFIFQGDVYLVNYNTGTIEALTADEPTQSQANFISDAEISFIEGHNIFIYHLEKRLAEQIATFKLENDPNKSQPETYLEKTGPRLIGYLKQQQQEQKFQQIRTDKLSFSKNHTYYLGNQKKIKTFRLSPDARWLLLGMIAAKNTNQHDNMPEFITADGFVKNRKVRPLVGYVQAAQETFYLIDLVNHQKRKLDLSKLPGINDDPLKSLKEKAAKKTDYQYTPQQGPRAVSAYDWRSNQGVEWSPNSQQVAVLLYSADNKDRWIIGVNVKQPKVKTLHWMSDEAWVNDWTFNEFGWMPDSQTLYYLSEETGYAHLYIKSGKRRARQLTEGNFEVSDISVSKSGDYLYFKANKKHPGIYETYRISPQKRQIEALTNFGGLNDYVLSPDEKYLAVRHSTTISQPELILVDLNNQQSTVITDSASDLFKSIPWQAPEVVAVPSSHAKQPVYSRYYAAQNQSKAGKNQKKPAVIFVHGAGYLQNSHLGWSVYFREFMFHQMLAQQGYAVLDMDYRASKGYGRDWRTAIYRQMGTPELEDLTDGVQWLIENANVDPTRVGVYGGSYGGFMTFMSLFKSPDLFAAGAALRPVTDWAHYNHGYSSNILNTPDIDPEAYERSSPIEFAQGLNKPLLICHGMVDDNVFFKDTVKLVQRLIELEKTEYFETAIYPVESHGFTEPSSWLDEYSRIYRLFEKHLNPIQ